MHAGGCTVWRHGRPLTACHSCAAPCSRRTCLPCVSCCACLAHAMMRFLRLQTSAFRRLRRVPACWVCGRAHARSVAALTPARRAFAGAGLLPLAGHHAPRRKTAQRAPAALPSPARSPQVQASAASACQAPQGTARLRPRLSQAELCSRCAAAARPARQDVPLFRMSRCCCCTSARF